MILVHCLSDIINPYAKEHLISGMLRISSIFGVNKHENK
jgi:hypothetical protein